MTDALVVKPRQGSAHLIGVELDVHQRQLLVALVPVFGDSVDGFWDVLQHQVEVRFIVVRLGEEAAQQGYDVGVRNLLHDGKLAVFEALVLQDPLYGHLR